MGGGRPEAGGRRQEKGDAFKRKMSNSKNIQLSVDS
jgi:hypothetical protein